jgi:SAM-dependent methyltransferase
MTSAELWAIELAKWSIPEEILAKAETSPWIHPPALFQIPSSIPINPSHEIALAALPKGGSVLDIGCGGGLAAFALSENAGKVIGVDHQAEMLEMFAANASERGIESETHLGFWPAVASSVPSADVLTVHNVFYNVPDLIPFIKEINSHANMRVVIEMPALHPLANLSGAWKYFWNIDRPTEPTPDLLVKVLSEMGIAAKIKYWSNEVRKEVDTESAIEFMRIRLCLPTSRIEEIRSYLSKNPPSGTREQATIWWDRM